MKNILTSVEVFAKERRVYFIWIDTIGLVWFLYTTGILSNILPMTVHQYVSNAIYSALGVLLIAGSAKATKVLHKRFMAGVFIMTLLNAIFEIFPIFAAPEFATIIKNVSTVADPIDFLSGLLGIALVTRGYYFAGVKQRKLNT